MTADDDTQPVTLSREQCLERLASAPLGRIGVSIDALPAILPVRFTLVDDSVVFRTTKGTKLDTAAKGAVIAFQADDYDVTESGWWSVLLQGIATPVGDPESDTEAEAEADTEADTRTPDAGFGSRGRTRLLRISSGNMHGSLFTAAGGRLHVGPD